MSVESGRLMTVGEVAARLHISIRKVWRDVAAGLFPPPVKIGRKATRWRPEDIEAVSRGAWIPVKQKGSMRHALPH